MTIHAKQNTSDCLVALSQWIDDGNSGRDSEAITWGRLAKIMEEAGEVIAAFIGATGQNPRKGITHSRADVMDELLDVAVTALGAYEHMAGHDGSALVALFAKIESVALRAGVVDVAGREPKSKIKTPRPVPGVAPRGRREYCRLPACGCDGQRHSM